MYRERTREKYTAEKLSEIYSYDHDSSIFPDHVLRVKETHEAFKYLRIRVPDELKTAADLSCGDARVPRTYFIRNNLILGDFVRRTDFIQDLIGPIEETIHKIGKIDVFFLLETLEHLDDPDAILREIRKKAKFLVLSTPCMQWIDENIEHYWCWDFEAVEAMLKEAHWTPTLYTVTQPAEGYRFQIWVAE